jgi:hypothetical protein
VTGSGVQYAPPPGLSTVGRLGTAAGATPTPVQAYYRLTELAGGTPIGTSGSAVLTLQVRARVSWPDVLALLTHQTTDLVKAGDDMRSGSLACVTCHTGPQVPNGIISFSASTLSSDQLYCELVGCAGTPALTAPADPTRPLVDPADVTATPGTAPSSAPPTSVLIRYPANLGGASQTLPPFHVGGNRCPPTPTPPPTALQAPSAEFAAGPPLTVVNPARCDLLYVLQWIEDGAHPY